MRIGVDSYSYHRYFGELRMGEVDPGERWTVGDVLDRAAEMRVDGVSLETCFLPIDDPSLGSWLAERLEALDLTVALAWGHPRGLDMGRSQEPLTSLLSALELAVVVGARTVRIVLGTVVHWQAESNNVVLQRLEPLVRRAAQEAAARGLELAIETHCDLSISRLLELIERVSQPNVGVTFDTANVVRIGADLARSCATLAPFISMVHLKDLVLAEADHGDPGGWWPCAPLGSGDLDLDIVLDILRASGFGGLACIEMATMHPDYADVAAVEASVAWLRDRLAQGTSGCAPPA